MPGRGARACEKPWNSTLPWTGSIFVHISFHSCSVGAMPRARMTLNTSFFRRLGFFSAIRFHASLISACRSGVTSVRFAFMVRRRGARAARAGAAWRSFF